MPPKKRTPAKKRAPIPKGREVARQIRAATCTQLRLKGMDMVDIGKTMSITHQTASNDITWYLSEVINKPVVERVAEQLAVLGGTRASTLALRDDLLAYLEEHLDYIRRWNAGEVPEDERDTKGAPELDNNAIGKMTALNDSIIKLMDHEAKLLGFYAPTKVEVTKLDENFADAAARILGKLESAKAVKAGRATITVTDAADHAVSTADVVDAEVIDVHDDWVDE